MSSHPLASRVGTRAQKKLPPKEPARANINRVEAPCEQAQHLLAPSVSPSSPILALSPIHGKLALMALPPSFATFGTLCELCHIRHLRKPLRNWRSLRALPRSALSSSFAAFGALCELCHIRHLYKPFRNWLSLRALPCSALSASLATFGPLSASSAILASLQAIMAPCKPCPIGRAF